MRQFECLILDWDGTLHDSTSDLYAALCRVAQQMGVTRVPDRRLLMGSPVAMHQMLFPDQDEAHYRDFIDALESDMVSSSQGYGTLFPKVAATLELLSKQGVKLSIATNMSRRRLDIMLTHFKLAHLFSDTVCANEFAPKPAADMANQLMQHLGVDRSNVLMIGDSQSDCGMAQAAGIKMCLVTYSGASADELAPAFQLGYTIDHFEGLLDII